MQPAEGSPDIVVRGAGPAGCALALALRGSPHRLALVGAGAAPRQAFRPIALSYASRLILERLDAWAELASSTPIERVHVSQQGAFGQTRLEARDAGVPALGYVVDYRALVDALRARLPVPPAAEAPEHARCTVHAEGSAALDAGKRYGQDAVVGLVRFSRPAGSVAYERFTAEGPLALLPFQERFALIWSARPARAAWLAECPARDFLLALGGAAGSSLGTPVDVEERSALPLALRVRRVRTEPRAVYIGNAAQTLHPVAGQGLNLALRDAWDLAQLLGEAPDPGDEALLRRYAASRRTDTLATIGVTDLLAELFVSRGLLARTARALALSALDVLPGPRRFFARRMIYGPSALP